MTAAVISAFACFVAAIGGMMESQGYVRAHFALYAFAAALCTLIGWLTWGAGE